MSITTTPESFRLKVKAERVNLHRKQLTDIENMFQAGIITPEEKTKMQEILSEEWH